MALHLALEGEEVVPPFEWVVSRICEEFNCLPSAALKELLDEPRGMALDILELRAYAHTKQQIDMAKREEDMPTGHMAEWVWRIQAEIVQRKGGGP